MTASLRVLGVDPGSRTTGYGIVEKSGSQCAHIDNGCLTTGLRDPLAQRLGQIYSGLMSLLDRYRPDVVAVEEVFFSRNASSALKLGESRGIVLLAATQKNLPIYEYAAREVKQAITGFGQASKEQMQRMIQRLLKLPEIAQEDASDALAVAVCHLQSYKMKKVVG